MLQLLLLFTVAGTISAAVRSRLESAARECSTCHGYGINRWACQACASTTAQQPNALLTVICPLLSACYICTNHASKGVALHLHGCCYLFITYGFMCNVMLKECHLRSWPCRCTLCSGRGAVGWEGKWNHKEPCPMCLGKRFVDCPECGGHFHRRIFNHHHHTGLTVTELVEAEQGTFAKLGD